MPRALRYVSEHGAVDVAHLDEAGLGKDAGDAVVLTGERVAKEGVADGVGAGEGVPYFAVDECLEQTLVGVAPRPADVRVGHERVSVCFQDKFNLLHDVAVGLHAPPRARLFGEDVEEVPLVVAQVDKFAVEHVVHPNDVSVLDWHVFKGVCDRGDVKLVRVVQPALKILPVVVLHKRRHEAVVLEHASHAEK